MYKVFIDHKRVVFTDRNELFTNSVQIEGETVKSYAESIEPHLTRVKDGECLHVVCDDVESVFKSAIKGLKWMDAAGGIVESEEHFLVIERHGLWDIPKGKVEKGESLDEAAIREVEEECGIDQPSLGKHLLDTYHVFPRKKKLILKRTAWYHMTLKERVKLTPQIEEGISKVEWLTRNELDGIRSNTFGSIIELLDRFDTFLAERD